MEGVIDTTTARRLAISLNQLPPPEVGSQLPLCWHWAWFNAEHPPNELGRDGHPKRGGFLPPVPLQRRMWAGGEIEAHYPLTIGKTARKASTIENIVEKNGATGPLVIVSIRHILEQNSIVCVSERQDLVFREDPNPGNSPPMKRKPCPAETSKCEPFTPDAVLMFRYSALTFNGHRIHYDIDYARQVEGYPNLVFHAPLSATLLHHFASSVAPTKSKVTNVQYRALAPLFVNETFSMEAKMENGGKIHAWIRAPMGHMAFEAWLTYSN